MFFNKQIWPLRYCFLVAVMIFAVSESYGQVPTRRVRPDGINLPGAREGVQPGKRDTLGFEQRDDLADSITISYRKFDSLGVFKLDSSINDFGQYYPLPTGYVSIGGVGNAAYPIFFTPEMKPGWNTGFTAFDVYKYTLANTRFYHTTRPFTSLHYYQGSGKEQVVKAFHTQNIKPNWNAGFNFRMISNPGTFQNQNSKDNNYRFFSSYQGRKKRYSAELIVLGNKLVSAENGGITDPALLADPTRKKRIAIPVVLGNNSNSSNVIFSNKIQAGNRYSDFDVFFRNKYDFGKRDSIAITDSTKEYLFYPKLRLQHAFRYQKSSFQFIDYLSSYSTNLSDSVFFHDRYDIDINPRGSEFYFLDKWEYISNDFSIRQFPETKNQNQFIEAGVRIETYSGSFQRPFIPDNTIVIFPEPPVTRDFFNAVLHGEYRNKTRNKKWDAVLRGEFYTAGFYTGEYAASASLQRYLNEQWGSIALTFDNVSRSPSFLFQAGSAFNPDSSSLTKKENITVLGFEASNRRFNLKVRNTSITNYAHLINYYEKDQFAGLINLTQGSLTFKSKVIGHLNLYSDFVLQQTAGNSPIKVPLLYTRQRLAFEGQFFKNLNLSTGLDIRYNTPYKANHYSPVLGRFFPQDSVTISNLPTVNVFFNFRIKNFTLFLSGENLNTVEFRDGFGFTNNNFAAPLYPTPGFIFRFAIKWDMVN